MSPQFIAMPPLPLGRGSQTTLCREVQRLFWSFLRVLWQPFVPYNPAPEPPDNVPAPTGELDDKQVEQCQSIFDGVEEARKHLEDKARATFTLAALLGPLLASLFVFILGRTSPGGAVRTFAMIGAAACFAFLLLGFISVARAVSVQGREYLQTNAVIDPASGQFRKYEKGWRARGLLYCAAVNQAMNDHIAQFVKGAHILTALAVISLVVAALPTAIAVTDHPEAPRKVELVGNVNVSPDTLSGVRTELASISKQIAALTNDKATVDALRGLDARIASLESRISELLKHLTSPPPPQPQNGPAPPSQRP